MPNYLTKEEIRQWRSSLEKITLEDYAKKLGKVINNEKETNDMADIVYKHSSEVRYVSNESENDSSSNYKAEKISSLAQKSFEREKEISLEKAQRDLTKILTEKKTKQKTPKKTSKKIVEKEVSKKAEKTAPAAVQEEIQITFKKNLTPREQAVFEHFLNNKNSIVYAKELAQVLDLPRDYVYKYIKNLRAKMNENAIQNADNGGFILEMK